MQRVKYGFVVSKQPMRTMGLHDQLIPKKDCFIRQLHFAPETSRTQYWDFKEAGFSRHTQGFPFQMAANPYIKKWFRYVTMNVDAGEGLLAKIRRKGGLRGAARGQHSGFPTTC